MPVLDGRHVGLAVLGGGAVAAGMVAAGAPLVPIAVAGGIGLILFGALGQSVIPPWEGTSTTGEVLAGLSFCLVGVIAVLIAVVIR